MQFLFRIKVHLIKKFYSIVRIFKPLLISIIPEQLKRRLRSIENKLIQSTCQNEISNNPVINSKLNAGVNLIGYARAEMGVGESCRLAANAIETAGIQFGILNFSLGNPATMNELSWRHKETDSAVYRTNIFHINANQMALAYLHFGDSIFKGHYNIGYWHWELPDFPDEWCNSFNLVHEVWVPTDFILDAVSKKSPVPVIKIPHGIEVKCSPESRRDLYKLPNEQFLFLTMFDSQSVDERKNPHAAIEAFKMAFSKHDESVGLILKINNSKDEFGHLNKLREEVRDYKNIYILDRYMNRQQVNDLLNCIDCFISLHRSEGFGLVLAEAMYLGKPVIGTNWSGNTDFMNKENSCLVNYRLVKLAQEYGPYKAGQVWADPDVEHAAFQMRKLVNDSVWKKQISLRGQETILNNYSPKKVGELVKERLESLSLI